MDHICQRCEKSIPEGGLFYHVRLSAVSGYDGVINAEDKQMPELVGDIEGQSAKELEETVFFEQEMVLCAQCRHQVVELFQREARSARPGGSGVPGNRLH